jgi:hypothetical protein
MTKKTKKKKNNNVEVVSLKSDDIRYNGGEKCDMKKGPCSCGAWH